MYRGRYCGEGFIVMHVVDVILSALQFRSLSSYISGCVPAEHHSLLHHYEGSLHDKAKQFVSMYCSHLASSNESGCDPGRVQALQSFLADIASLPISSAEAEAIIIRSVDD
jgi:hypothetical protein